MIINITRLSCVVSGKEYFILLLHLLYIYFILILNMNNYMLKNSSRKDKKYMLVNPQGKKIHFGAAKMSDYTIHKDDVRKDRYIARHQKNENWDEINPGSLSRYILWNKKTLNESIKDYEKLFNIKIVN